MKHRINGCPIDLRSLSTQELDNLVAMTRERAERVQEELESVEGERLRRQHVYQLRFEYEGPSVA
jgi:hypothetical protein